jgi:hypothetical protein
VKSLFLAAAAVLVALAAVPTAGATNECRGLNPCVPVAGPWVVVPAGTKEPRAQAQFQLTCPKGYVAAGIDAELSDQAIDVGFIGFPGTPVGPGTTTSRSVVFVASYTGSTPRAPTFRPHIGCVPAQGGGSRTPTGLRAVTPPGHPTVRRVVTGRVRGESTLVASCHADERLVGWYSTSGFATPSPPSPALVRSLRTRTWVYAKSVNTLARTGSGQGMIQVGAICAGGK